MIGVLVVAVSGRVGSSGLRLVGRWVWVVDHKCSSVLLIVRVVWLGVDMSYCTTVDVLPVLQV